MTYGLPTKVFVSFFSLTLSLYGCTDKSKTTNKSPSDIQSTPPLSDANVTKPVTDTKSQTQDTARSVPQDLIEIGDEVICAQERPPGIFVDERKSLGVTFVHNNKPTEQSGPLATLAVGGGVAVHDLDGDGWLDLYFTSVGGQDEMYLTGGRGPLKYERHTPPKAGTSLHVGVFGADADNDGDTDLLMAPMGIPTGLIINDGKGNFSIHGPLITDPSTTFFEQSAAWGDVNGDGILDIAVAGGPKVQLARGTHTGGSDRLFIGHSNLDFSPEPLPEPSNNGQAFISAFLDYDNDGDQDIYVVNDFGMDVLPNRLLRNDNGQWTDVSDESQADLELWGMGLATGDFNNDGWLDLYITSMTPLDDALLRNNRDGTFDNWTYEWDASTVTKYPGISWGAIFIDVDSDGDEDLFVTHGYHDALGVPESPDAAEQTNVLLLNTGSGFIDGTPKSGLGGVASSRSPVEADLNADGFPDLIVGNLGTSPYIYLNGCNTDSSWVGIRLKPQYTNLSAIGARITVVANGRKHMREINSGSDGLYGSGPSEQVIGLGQAQAIDRIEVKWLGGATSEWTNLPVRRWITLWE